MEQDTNSRMRLKDICSLTYPLEDLQPFCIKSTKNGTFCVMSKHCVQILSPKFSFSMDLNRFNFTTARIKCPQSCTTGLLDTSDAEIYNTASLAQKQDILLDQRYLPKLSNPLIQSRAVAWSPTNWDGNHYLAYLSNYGGLEIFRDEGDGIWQSYLNVGDYWFSYLVKDYKFPIRTFIDLDKLVQDILFSTLCWDDSCEGHTSHRLLGATKSNKLVLFNLHLFEFESNESRIDVQRVVEIQQNHITALKWIQTGSSDVAFLVAGSLEGKICLYTIDIAGNIELKTTLWGDEDQLATGTIEFISVEEKLLIVATKGAHVLFFLLDLHGTCISEAVELIPEYSVTGLIQLNSSKLLVSSLGGNCYLIDIQTVNDQINVTAQTVSYTFNLSKYSVYGIAASPNKAYFTLACFATHPHDHLVLRQPANLVICRSNAVNPLQTIIANPELNIDLMIDYAEVVRYIGGKEMSTLRFLESQIDLETNVSLTNEYLGRVRAAVVVNAARYSYFRLRSRNEAENSRKNAEFLYNITEVIRAYHVLKQLLQSLPQASEWSENQKRAGRALLTFLEIFTTTNVPVVNSAQLQNVQAALVPLLSSVIKPGRFLYEIWTEVEFCSYCDSDIPIDGFTCTLGHQRRRCSISQLQLYTFKQNSCPYCRHSVLTDENLLREITLNKPNLLTCPLCNVPLVNDNNST